MNLPFRQFRQLRGLERGLRRSEPHLVAMLAIFARLNAGEMITSREQALPTAARAGRVMAVLAGAVASMAAAGRWLLSLAARACTAVRRRFSGSARAPLSTSSAVRNRIDPGSSLGL